MKELLSTIIIYVLFSVYQPLWYAVAMSIVTMYVWKAYWAEGELTKHGKGIKGAVKDWACWFYEDKDFRRMFSFIFITVLILFRTILNRELWSNPLNNVWGVWGFYNPAGEFTADCVLNFCMFVPFSFLFLHQERSRVGERKIFSVIWKSVTVSFLFSLTIECLQLILYVGTWQLSDLFYNTVGGMFGGICYLIVRRWIK